MKRRRLPCRGRRPAAAAAARSGTSLVEVLMSLLVMGVGVVAVATLFPASVLRSVQATQLTNATILRYNAEAAIDIDPRLIYDPNADGTVYNEPNVTTPNRFYMIDPYGRAVNGTTTVGTGAAVPLPRYDGGRAGSVDGAMNYVTQPDSWVSESETIDFVPASTLQSGMPARTTSITLRNQDISDRKIDLTSVQNQLQAGIGYRVILFDAEGRLSEIRNLTYVDGTDPIDPGNREIKWTNTPLPNETRYASISKVRIEKFEPRYSWLMTIRRPNLIPPILPGTPITADVSVAVLFRRSVNAQEEIAYQATIENATNSRPDYSITKFDNADPNPFIKKGGYLLDLDNARWYRIASVSGTQTAPKIKLDRSPPKDEFVRNVMFYRGVVDVYPFTKQVKAP
jgi:type II secretory pathway pseudopilin PulG